MNIANGLSFIFFGTGSIGQRHIRNLKSLGIDSKNIYIYEPNNELAEKVSKEHGVVPVDDGSLWSNKYSVAFVTNPNSMHFDTALAAAKHGCHLFIEKPLATSLDGLDELLDIAKQKNLISIVGCNMRFHPGPAKVKQLLDEKVIGRILSGHVETGSFLPGWRPWQDYKESYSARKDLGGGCVLDCIHEIDLTCWYFGIPQDLKSYVSNTGFIGIECEDVADILMRYEDGFSCFVHIDYIQQTYERKCRIVGEKGTIWWDTNAGEVKVYLAADNSFTKYCEPIDYDDGEAYVEELKHFLDCVDKKVQTQNSIFSAVEILKTALKAKGELK
ncbi:MAG: Gfo/Idh/MocA family oxidoreductase [Planctomycetes bacterium]|nr:Gfo/Idh/MocA family oxidoreductase [Planctomycetota bacterium]